MTTITGSLASEDPHYAVLFSDGVIAIGGEKTTLIIQDGVVAQENYKRLPDTTHGRLLAEHGDYDSIEDEGYDDLISRLTSLRAGDKVQEEDLEKIRDYVNNI